MVQSTLLKEEVESVVGAIRSVFEIEGDLDEADIETLQTRLVDCIQAVNARLKSCDELLRKGLRSEAIQECEISPRLLDLVTELDFDEWDAWADYVRQFGIPAQPPLLVDVASSLNDAYFDDQPLQEILNQHRLHAIARSPLSRRLEILRAIAARDPSNGVWKTDLKAYETARMREIVAEIKQWKSPEHLKSLSDLVKEIKRPDWLTPPDENLKNKVLTTYQQVRQEDARQNLTRIAGQLNAAFSDFNSTQAQGLRDEWETYADIAELSDDDPLALEASAALDWLDDEAEEQYRKQELERSIMQLEQGLDKPKISAEELGRLFRNVERFDEPIPDRIRRRYNDRLEAIRLAGTRRSRLILLCSIAAVLMVGALVAMGTMYQVHSSRLADANSKLKTLVADGKLNEAESFLEKLKEDHPAVASAPSIVAIESELGGLLAAESNRRINFSNALDKAEQLATLEASWDDIQSADNELENARQLARLDGSEAGEIMDAERVVQQAKNAYQDRIDEDFRTKAKDITDRLASIESVDMATLKSLAVEARQLRNTPRVSTEARKIAEVIETRIQAEQDRREMLRDQQMAMQRVFDAIGSPPEYGLALKRFEDLVQAGDQVSDFKKVRQEQLPLLDHLAAWKTLQHQWNPLGYVQPVKMTQDGLAAIKTLEETYPGFPGAKEVVDQKPYIESLKYQVTNKTLDKLRSTINQPIVQMLSLDTEKGERYFFLAQPEIDERKITIYPLLSVQNASAPKPMSMTLEFVKRRSDGSEYGPSPQKMWADKALEYLDDKKGQYSNWDYERRICAVLGSLNDAPEIDPLIRLWLFKQIADTALPASEILQEELEDLKLTLDMVLRRVENFRQKLDIGKIDLLASTEDPRRAIAKETWEENYRDKYGINSENSPLRKAVQRAASVYSNKPSLPDLSWVGALKNEGGKWFVMTNKDPRTGDLKILAGDKAAPKLVDIGKVTGGDIQLASSSQQDFVEGQPVLLVTPP